VLPERPVPALRRANFINSATPALFGLLQKYAIARVRVLDNRQPKTHAPHKFLLQFFHGHFQEIGNQPNFGPADPDISPLRPGAAMPALQALKVQPSRIPGNFIAEIHNIHFTAEKPNLKSQYRNPKYQTSTKPQVANTKRLTPIVWNLK
jgi:hypothetical protein